MNIYVYPTDRKWFDFLGSRPGTDEVNFWRPGGIQVFRGLSEGEILLFRLASPVNMIAGGGVFLRSGLLPLSLMWESFGDKNGSPTFDLFKAAIARFKKVPANRLPLDSSIGYIMLLDPVFLPRAAWIPVPDDYQQHLVQGKAFNAATGSGKRLFEWARSDLFRQRPRAVGERALPEPSLGPTMGPETLARRRLGQGSFRVLVTEIYDKRCAVTGERTLPVLEAAHIQPVSAGGEHRASNGLLLRSDIHTLFDLGYVGVDPNLTFRVSDALREQFQNGRIYYELQGRQMRPPNDATRRPDRQLLEWHSTNVFRG